MQRLSAKNTFYVTDKYIDMFTDLLIITWTPSLANFSGKCFKELWHNSTCSAVFKITIDAVAKESTRGFN